MYAGIAAAILIGGDNNIFWPELWLIVFVKMPIAKQKPPTVIRSNTSHGPAVGFSNSTAADHRHTTKNRHSTSCIYAEYIIRKIATRKLKPIWAASCGFR